MTDDWREDGEWGSVLEIHQILDGAGVADSAAVEDRVRLVVERAEKAEAAARDFAAQLHALADLHHRTTRPSKLHDPERQPDYRECGCKTCCWASRAFERHPEYARTMADVLREDDDDD